MTLEADLHVLLTQFQKTRSPRVADLVDRVSADLAKQRGPVPGKSISARLTSAIELAKKKDAADLGRLTQLEWPGTWQKALPFLRVLLESFPGDPRLEAHLARTFAEPPWDSWASWGFFTVLHPALRSLTDTRLVPVLEAGDSRAHPSWYAQTFRSWVHETIARLKAATPAPLSSADLAALTRIEARYVDDTSREKEKARGEAELLDAIYARPNDRQLRAVFADWLTERNDPRGECITLELASERTRAQQTRLNALIKKHGADWAGSLDEWFEHDQRRFELGFLVGGKLVARAPRPIEGALKDPLWKMISALEMEGRDAPPSALLPQLRELYGVDPQASSALLNGPEPLALELITFARTWNEDAFADIADCSAAKRLRAVGFVLRSYSTPPLDTLPVLKRVEKVLFLGAANASEVMPTLTKKFPNVKTVEFLTGDDWLVPEATRFTLSREAAGPFTTATGYTTSTELLLSIAAAIEPEKVKSLRLKANRTLPLRENDRKNAEEMLSKFKNATIEVPWERQAAKPAQPLVKATGDLLRLRFVGGTFLKADMHPLWSALTGAGFHFDAYNVGYGAAHRPLGKKPVEALSKWGANERCHRLELYRDGGDERLSLGRRDRGREPHSSLEFRRNARPPEVLIELVESLLAAGGDVQSGALELGDELFWLFDPEVPSGRLNVFGPEFRRRLPEKKIIAAVKRQGGFAHAGRHGLYFTPATGFEKKPTDAAMRALKDAVWPLIIEHFVERTGLDFQRELERSFWKAAARLGFTKDTSERDAPHVNAERAKGDFRLSAWFSRFFTQPSFRLELRKLTSKNSSFSLRLADGALEPETFKDALTAATTLLATEGPKWMKDPQHYERPR